MKAGNTLAVAVIADEMGQDQTSALAKVQFIKLSEDLQISYINAVFCEDFYGVSNLERT